jgi:hypothetical protein
VCVHTDEFADPDSFPQDPEAWYRSGADLDDIDTPRLVECLQDLCAGTATKRPKGNEVIKPTRHIVVDEHFGRMRKQVAGFFDLVFYIDAPLEVAFARGIRQRSKWVHRPVIQQIKR